MATPAKRRPADGSDAESPGSAVKCPRTDAKEGHGHHLQQASLSSVADCTRDRTLAESPPTKAKTPGVVFQKLHLTSRTTDIYRLMDGPKCEPKVLKLSPPASLAVALGPNIDVCWCTSRICKSAERGRSFMHVQGSRRLCGRTTDEHPEGELLRRMTEQFFRDLEPTEFDGLPGHAEETFNSCLTRKSTAAFLLRNQQVLGYVCLVQSFPHGVFPNAPGLSDAVRLKALPPCLPLLMQVFVDSAYRRQGVCSQALRRAFKGKDAIAVDCPTKAVVRALQASNFQLAGYRMVPNPLDEKAIWHARAVYIRLAPVAASSTAPAEMACPAPSETAV
mmetsp:Transcript_8963/g.27219  ORF Transcript_8963/g.27219 Transcript_8963/m.27219 type:complete len:334 (-) Transcript_8963:160-1161(-)